MVLILGMLKGKAILVLQHASRDLVSGYTLPDLSTIAKHVLRVYF